MVLRYIAPTYRVLPPLTCFLAVLCVDRFQTAMFYSQIILAKKGALSKIWIAAHVSSKLKKDDIFKTDITEAVSLYRCFFFSFPFSCFFFKTRQRSEPCLPLSSSITRALVAGYRAHLPKEGQVPLDGLHGCSF